MYGILMLFAKICSDNLHSQRSSANGGKGLSGDTKAFFRTPAGPLVQLLAAFSSRCSGSGKGCSGSDRVNNYYQNATKHHILDGAYHNAFMLKKHDLKTESISHYSPFPCQFILTQKLSSPVIVHVNV